MSLRCGNICLRPFEVLTDETEWPVEHTVSANKKVLNCTIFATDGTVREYLFWSITATRSPAAAGLFNVEEEAKDLTFSTEPKSIVCYRQ